MARKSEIGRPAGNPAIGSTKPSPTFSTRANQLRRTLRDIACAAWQENPFYASFFIVFSAAIAGMLWPHSQNLWLEVPELPRVLLRLIAPVTAFILSVSFYFTFKWWWIRHR